MLFQASPRATARAVQDPPEPVADQGEEETQEEQEAPRRRHPGRRGQDGG